MLQLARRGADRERLRRIPALAGQRASFAVGPVGENGSVPVEQFSRCDELRGVGGAGVPGAELRPAYLQN